MVSGTPVSLQSGGTLVVGDSTLVVPTSQAVSLLTSGNSSLVAGSVGTVPDAASGTSATGTPATNTPATGTAGTIRAVASWSIGFILLGELCIQ